MDKMEYQAEILFNRLKKKYKHLKKWAKRMGTDTFRLYDRDIPEIPLVIDLYKDAIAGAFFERQEETAETDRKEWLDGMKSAISQAVSIQDDRIFLKVRKPQRGNSQYEKMDHKNFFVDVHEGGLVFRVNLSDYLDTGLFLDRRSLRRLVCAEAAGKRILNLFCYTGAFSIHAVNGGAAGVDSVDMSNTYLDWAKVNFSLNRFRAEITSQEAALLKDAPGFRLIRADVLRFLDAAARARRVWDVIILDPPTFSNSKRMFSDLDVKRDYMTLVSKCLPLLEKHGKIFFSTSVRRIKVDFSALNAQNITEKLRDEDFRGKRTPECWEISNQSATHRLRG
ncbi:MAG: class I SAM-dependent methyltransferase [Treponema sp.]|jgi:23S rRNA G2069 N7-methylase RlmK/C1962 C5-methylase RlmI|nr:class I SAM-dependent methyltransferase [Treponema sp.]